MSWGYGYREYVPASRKKENLKKTIDKLKKKKPDLSPVIVEGRKIAKTWWGAAWNNNLESYADYANRIGRGRSYVRSGMVVDLKIDKGEVNALVQGSSRSPYKVKIQIDRLPDKKWERITKECGHKIADIAELAEGRFPKELALIFLKQGDGLFPSPKEIRLSCSCPDWADMCKHVCAVLYGVGARLDDDPLLFFTLRDIDFSVFLKKSVEEKIGNILKNADKKSDRIIENADIAGLFGI